MIKIEKDSDDNTENRPRRLRYELSIRCSRAMRRASSRSDGKLCYLGSNASAGHSNRSEMVEVARLGCHETVIIGLEDSRSSTRFLGFC